jgi:Uma2 family endonuclease
MFERARTWVSPEEYLELEEQAEYKSEYFNGEIFAMAGGSPEHSAIALNIGRELGNQLEARPCLVFNSDLRVRVAETGLYTYPDVTVVCGEPEFDDRRRALLNPTLIVEVLSDSTEKYDRGDKSAHYRRLPSLREYVLVASDRARIECFTRQEDGARWLLTECSNPGGTVPLESIGCELALSRVYAKVEFPEPAPGQRRGPLP